MKKIVISKDFSRHPSGRKESDGPFNANKLVETLILPHLLKNNPVEINFDNTRGYSSAFLEEIFLVLKKNGFSKESLQEFVSIKTESRVLKAEINIHILKVFGNAV